MIEPRRTKTNIRYYEDEDLKFILNVALLNKNGIKISKIAKMARHDIAEKVSAISEVNFEFDTQLDALTLSMIEMDEYKFDRIITMNVQKMGFERTMLEIIQPFLDRLSLLWLTGSIRPVQENFISYLIRQKIVTAIDNEPFILGGGIKKFLLFLPEGESQELSLLFLHYLLKVRRNQVIYIGQDMSISDLEDVFTIHKPDYLYTMITETFSKEPVQQYIDTLVARFPDCQIMVSGYQVLTQNVKSSNRVTILKSLDQTIKFLDQLKNRSSNGTHDL